ncbi:MAG: hypothetical protein KME35_19460 [Aphanocapsa sp. GSE-SYN-MK-11-07L]|nr:hypothetical protein [Aphanocapsa sp. GSE-SYN-MK-11-07L]
MSSNLIIGFLEPTQPAHPVAFTVAERDRIIAAFENHQGKGSNHSCIHIC